MLFRRILESAVFKIDKPSTTRRIHNYSHPEKGDNRADYIESVGCYFIDAPSPEKRDQHENAAVSRLCAPETGRLKCRQNSVDEKHDCAGKRIPGTFVFPQPEPDQIRSAEFGDSRDDKEKN